MAMNFTPVTFSLTVAAFLVPSGHSLHAVDPPQALVERYCLACHDADVKKGGLDLGSILDEDLSAHTAVWETVVRQLNTRQMPPVGKKRPGAEGYDGAVAELTAALDDLAERHPRPGRTLTLRRLTRVEYQNAVRDLLAVDLDASKLLPADEASHGFDNVTVGDLPPALLDRYLTAAQKIARLAVGASTESEIMAVRVRPDITQEYQVPGLPLGTRGGVLIPRVFAQSGDYEVQVRLQRDRNEQVEGMNGNHELQVLLDREVMTQFTVQPANDKNYEMIDAHLKTRFRVVGGQHDLGVTFLPNGSPVLERLRQPYKSSTNLHRHPRLSPAVYQVTITGPLSAQGVGDTPSRRMLFQGKAQDAKAVLMPVLQRAYRRPVTEEDFARLEPFVTGAPSFEAGIESALAAILVSREFLFRAEQDQARSPYRLSDLELASRLSFFLWSSIPDEALLAGTLNVESQTRRMLRDPRAKSLVTNFADQWLYLRNLESITPDARLFPDFDDNLREALRKETSLLFEDIVKHDRSVLELLRTDRTWLDERLAAHYGIPHVYGSRFREVKLEPGWQRGGLLRQGSILTVTSYATRTSPVIRGHWILKNLLGSPPPPPPPNVPALDGVISETLPIRERLAKHRENPACASCHALMDPVGFALESYDAMGRWHDLVEGRPVDNNGGFADGSEFSGVAGLEDVLLQRPELFVGTLTEKLLTYALGRGLEPDDAPAVRAIVRRAKAHDWRFSEIVGGITSSVPFTMRSR
ncbi:MAG: DUF1592 domain-containing protein [Verrucomicrobiales bacterium]|nr:DUF1592 domain-containing protein [Verrucomicrobiae bacterium]MCP5552690.1 DUF1592 domain-containing protein [Akkermansiaceae bacterium]